MSWSLNTATHPASEISSAIKNAEPSAHLSEEQLEQLRQAKETAISLLESGVVGDFDAEREDVYFSASMSGHGTEDHQPGDSVTVTVIRQTAPPPAGS